MKKELYLPYFKDKKITVLGLGLLGRGVGDTAFLVSNGADVIVTDKKNATELATSINALTLYQHITYRLGGHELQDFQNRDFILKGAGVPLESDYVREAKENNIPIYMSGSLLTQIVMAHLPNVKVVGVTGTRGKSTTTYLIDHILRTAGKKVHLGGNIRGVANLPLLESIEDGDVLLLELDSWQLQGFHDAHISPHIAVFTSFLDDHLNYYHGDRELYFNDKAAIFQYQKSGDVLIASPQAHSELAKRGLGDDAIVPEIVKRDSNLIGDHNQTAIALACEVAKLFYIDAHVVHEAIKTFTPASGRLELLGEFHGVKVYNDNNATTPDATIAAIDSVNKEYGVKPIVILGGTDKNLSLVELERVLQENTKACVYLYGTGTDKITIPKEYMYDTLEACLKKAFELATAGDILLFSPGFASFGKQFNNEYERNDAFVIEVQKYA